MWYIWNSWYLCGTSCTICTTCIILDVAAIYVHVRVESGSDDPDNMGHLGHFFGGSSGYHPQTKLSGCDPEITCSLENSAGIW